MSVISKYGVTYYGLHTVTTASAIAIWTMQRLSEGTFEHIRTAKIQTRLHPCSLVRIFAVRLHNIGTLLKIRLIAKILTPRVAVQTSLGLRHSYMPKGHFCQPVAQLNRDHLKIEQVKKKKKKKTKKKKTEKKTGSF